MTIRFGNGGSREDATENKKPDYATEKARADALEKANEKLAKDLEAVRADNAARDPVAARQRRMQRTDAGRKFSFEKADLERTDTGLRKGLGLYGVPGDEPVPDDDRTDDGDADAARARRIARTSK